MGAGAESGRLAPSAAQIWGAGAGAAAASAPTLHKGRGQGTLHCSWWVGGWVGGHHSEGEGARAVCRRGGGASVT